MIVLNFILCCFVALSLLHKVSNTINPILKFIIAIVLGFTIISYTFTFSLFIGISYNSYVLIILLLSLLYLTIKYRWVKENFNNALNSRLSVTHTKLVIILTSILVFTSLFFNNITRWGKWDAWAFWIPKAKFMVSDADFFNLFANEATFAHADYPLMLPSLIAVIWKDFNLSSPLIPVFVALGICMVLIFSLYASVLENNSKNNWGLIVLIIAISAFNFDVYGSYQYADTLLSIFFLLPVVIYTISKDKLNSSTCLLIGFMAASATWVKNEGILFVLIFSFFFIIEQVKNKKQIFYYAIGLVFPILILTYFKLNLTPTNDLVERTSASTLNKLVEFDRYILIFDYIKNELVQNFPLAFILIICGIAVDYNYIKSMGFKIIVFMFTAYFFIYIFTPYGLDWHLRTSISRLFHQISPLILFSVFHYFSINYTSFLSKGKDCIS